METDKKLDILDIKTWFCISILAYIYIVLLIVRECQCWARYRPVEGLIEVYKYIYLYYFKYKYKFY